MGMTPMRALPCALAAFLLASPASTDDRASYAVRGKHFDARDVPTYRI